MSKKDPEKVRKIVVNRCFGGFGLSDAAMRRYFELKGWPFHYEDRKDYPGLGMGTYWRVPPSLRPKPIENWSAAPLEERRAYNDAYSEASVYGGDIPRDDPALVQVVEELGKNANGRHAELEVVSIPADVKWVISEYDGKEHVAEDYRTW